MQMRVWWVPQAPMDAFYQEVSSLAEAKLILDTLAMYDLFQLEHAIRPEFTHAGGLQCRDPYHEGSDDAEEAWVEWRDPVTHMSLDDMTDEEFAEAVERERTAGGTITVPFRPAEPDPADFCKESADGRHYPDWKSVSIETDGDVYIDVNCGLCGRSGCVGNQETLEDGILW